MSRSSSAGRGEADVGGVHGHATSLPAAFVGLLAAGLIDQDAAHGLGRGGEEVAAIVPALLGIVADQAHIRFVDQRGGLQRLPGILPGQSLRRQLAQLVVDQRQQLLGGLLVALLDGGQDAGDFTHRDAPGEVEKDEMVRFAPPRRGVWIIHARGRSPS